MGTTNNFLQILKKPNGAISLMRVLILLYGVELAGLIPYVVIKAEENPVLVSVLVFYSIMVFAGVYGKVVDSKYLSIGIKDGESK